MTARWPWEVMLNDVIGEIAAEDAQREHGVQGLKEPVVGLTGIFGVRSELRQRACRRLAQRLNQDPINIAAQKWLPPDWRSDSEHLHLLTLMLWGVTDGNLAAPSYWETGDVVGGLIANMRDWNPAFVMAVLQNPEHPELADEGVSLGAESLAQAPDAESAAAYLLEAIEVAAISGQLHDPHVD